MHSWYKQHTASRDRSTANRNREHQQQQWAQTNKHEANEHSPTICGGLHGKWNFQSAWKKLLEIINFVRQTRLELRNRQAWTGGVMQFYLSAIDRGLPALHVMAHCFIAVSAVEFSIVR